VARTQRMHQRDRKTELVEIAYRLIAQKGLEGFRIRQVAAEAGIDNGTRHYHFRSKEALIHGVVDYLMEHLQNNHAVRNAMDPTALDELHMEFEDIRLRLRRTPEQFIVLSESGGPILARPRDREDVQKARSRMARSPGSIAEAWHSAGHISKEPECAVVREGDHGNSARNRLSIQTSAA
jgi:AcrR family transcriptional regulator